MITIRIMESCELTRIGEIDRSEKISQDYIFRDGSLLLKDAPLSVPLWTQDGQGEHSISGKINAWQPLLEEGGKMFGAFDDETFVAFVIYRPHLTADTAQLAVLHVSRLYRRRGLGSALAAKVIESAQTDGARKLYVSSAPTKGTVEFYRSLGFRPAREINRELFKLEPEDIHMTMEL